MAEGRRLRREAIERGEEVPLSRRSRNLRSTIEARVQAAAAEVKTPEITNSPEFKAALEAALNDKLPMMLAAVAQANGLAKEESPKAFAAALALQMAKFTGQGVGKTYVDPEELERRTAAKNEMLRLLKFYQQAGEIPAYRLIDQVQLVLGQFGPVVIEPVWRGADRVQHDTEIDYAWIPNLKMVPLNEPAKKVFAQFEIWVAAELPQVAEADLLEAGPNSPFARGPAPQPGVVALTRSGNVVHGAAATAMIRNDPALREDYGRRDQGSPMHPMQAAVIRRGEDPAVRKKQVYGTLTEPIEMR